MCSTYFQRHRSIVDFKYLICNEDIIQVNEVHDLGIIFSKKPKF